MGEGFPREEASGASVLNHGAGARARTVRWHAQGNRYDILGEDGHSFPLGGRLLPRESESGKCCTRHMMPHIKLGSYRGTVVEERGSGSGGYRPTLMSPRPLLRGPIEPTRNDAGGWT